QVLRTLAGYLGEEEAGLHQGVRASGGDRERYQGIVLRRDVDWQGVVALETHQLDLPGISLRVAPKRYYPFGPLAAHLLGYVGEVSKSELAQDDGDYVGGDLVEDRKHPLNNRAVQGVFPPGSTFKVAVATGALEEGVVTPFTGVTCTGGIPFGNHFFHCWKKGGHGAVDLHKAIVESCDVFFYQVGRRLGVDGIAEYAHRLGLGLPT